MSRLMHRKPKPDVLEVVHHEIPDNAAAAGAAAIPEQRAATSAMSRVAYREGGITWWRMARYVAVTEAVGLVAILVMGAIEGLDAFYPAWIAAILFGVAAFLLPRGTKASAVYTLVVSSVMLVLMGGLFFGWSGFLHPLSYFEMTFATLSTLVPIAGIVATIADSACGYAAFSVMSEDSAVLSIEFKTNMLAPANGERVIARAKVTKSGRTIIVCDATVHASKNGAEKLVATMTGTMMAVRRPNLEG